MFTISRNGRVVDFFEAVEASTTPDYSEGQLENMRNKSEKQDRLIARMLMVQFNDYADQFTGREYEPKTDAEKLAFILEDFKVE